MECESRLGQLRVFRQVDWLARFPDLLQGVTGRDPTLDFGNGQARENGWTRLLRTADVPSIARCRQVHGATVCHCDGIPSPGISVLGEADAIVSAQPGVLLSVTVADCVPVFFVDPDCRALGLAHAGWRGAAAGVVQSTLAAIRTLGASPNSLYVHLGPAICGACYEVGPEVPAALGGLPETTRHVDLRAHIARAIVESGIDVSRITSSASCTRCDAGSFYSYRGGDRGRRMAAFLGWAAS